MMEERILSVKELNRYIKGIVEGSFAEVKIRGEVSNVRSQSSGHTYFSLKDADSQIKAALFRNAARGNVELVQHGRQVVVRGRLSVYEPRGEYSIIVNDVEEDGVGQLQRRFEALKKLLHGEGLFDPESKRALPVMPRRIGVVTSPSGAALRDFLGILQRRDWRGDVVVFPCRVQGQEAIGEIAAQIERASEREDLDLLVVTRGGGSLEDLWAFNEEAVVRALVACNLPTISAVGHEIDTVLTDFTADRRAETPSGAAELISSAFVDLRERVGFLKERVDERVLNQFGRLQRLCDLAEQQVERHSPQNRIEREWMRLDEIDNRLARVVERSTLSTRSRLDLLSQRLRNADPSIRIERLKDQVASLGHRLEACSVSQTLKRGFAMVKDQDGRLLTTASKARKRGKFEVQFHDGHVSARPVKDADQRYLDL